MANDENEQTGAEDSLDVPPGLVAGAFRESRHPRQPGDTRNWGCIKARGEDLSERLSNDH